MSEEAVYELPGWFLCKCAAVCVHMCIYACVCVCVLPDKVGAVAAEGGLFEEAGCELVIFDLDNPLVFERSLPLEHGHPGWRGEGRGQRGGTRGGC